MCEKNITNKRTPLRNSNSANKPFRSPLTTVLTPKNNESPQNSLCQSSMQKSATPKRSISQFPTPIKRRRIDCLSRDETTIDATKKISRSDNLAAKRRICTKRQELDNLKTKLNYIKKHKSEDLTAQISKWRIACKEALFQFHKVMRDTTSKNMTMRQILAMLEIPEETVKFTNDECDLT